MRKIYLGYLLLWWIGSTSILAQTVNGVVIDELSGEPLTGVRVMHENGKAGALTNGMGNFSFKPPTSPPFKITVYCLFYDTVDVLVSSLEKPIEVRMSASVSMDVVEITGRSISEKENEAPLTVESMGSIAIKEVASADFYASLSNMKGVDITSASLGFKVINTRGFNSTSPIRSLQIIDGIDNQAPGLNFSLGNFLGASELDVQKVDLIVGASSAFYGPNAFNGVISMLTKSPFIHQGLSIQARLGERNLAEIGMRYAKAFRNKNDRNVFAFKLNAFFLKADDWIANNIDATPQSEVSEENPGGYDQVNRYGDENLLRGINRAVSKSDTVTFPGLGIWHRDGYRDQDVVNYDTRNAKLSGALHYLTKDSVEFIGSSNFGYGTTVYQGDNRYSLKDITFFQHRIEARKAEKWFIRSYYTHENSGNSYDAVFTAFLMQDASKSDIEFSRDYRNYWQQAIVPKVRQLPGYPSVSAVQFPEVFFPGVDSVLRANPDSLAVWHQETRDAANSGNPVDATLSRYEPGTIAYDSVFNEIITKTSFNEGGTKLFDKSALAHVQAQYKFTPAFMDIVVGGSYRQYRPNSQGTIFSDTNGVVIRNQEAGGYLGLQKRFMGEDLKLNATLRVDKNQNFDYNLSPAVSAVYYLDEKNILRGSFSSGIRNPTLNEQYLFYNVGRAVLLGNVNGFDSLVTIESLNDYFVTAAVNEDTLDWYNIDPIRTEKVRSLEVGYRSSIKEHLFIDASYYYSIYRDFIGFSIGAVVSPINPITEQRTVEKIYRIAANSTTRVTTQGFSIGLNYYFKTKWVLNGNYSWNRLNQLEKEDPILPAFNTPEHKFNIGLGARNLIINIGDKAVRGIGFNTNFKWVQGFEFVGSPQFTGYVPTYHLLDAQINKYFKHIKSTVKLGASNILNRQQMQVFGGPYIGRMAYLSVRVDLDNLH